MSKRCRILRRWRVFKRRWERAIRRYGDVPDVILAWVMLPCLLALGWTLTSKALETIQGLKPIVIRAYAVLMGLETSLILGLFSGWFLNTYVTVRHPKQLKKHDFEGEGGGAFLGFLERVLFFASFWQSAFFAAGWLAFKLGAKWKVWEQIIKVPEDKVDLDKTQYLQRERLGSRVLGRFLNGTLYNAVCGLIGACVTKGLWSLLKLT